LATRLDALVGSSEAGRTAAFNSPTIIDLGLLCNTGRAHGIFRGEPFRDRGIDVLELRLSNSSSKDTREEDLQRQELGRLGI
jgi:hypothetical protein